MTTILELAQKAATQPENITSLETARLAFYILDQPQRSSRRGAEIPSSIPNSVNGELVKRLQPPKEPTP